MSDRKPNLRSSIYEGKDGWWHGWVTVGVKDDGSPDRRHRMAHTEAGVTSKVQQLERDRDKGAVRSAAKNMTVGQWMETWLTTIAPRRVRQSTLERTYEPKVRNRIIPGLGKHRLDRLTPEHLERFYARLEADGLAPSTVLQVHRILSRALKVASQRGYVGRNLAALIDAPAASLAEIEPLTAEEAKKIVKLTAWQRNGTRWSVALALGLRQGEALGLRWQTLTWANERLRSGGSSSAWPGGTAATTPTPAVTVTADARTAGWIAPAMPGPVLSGPAVACA